MNRMIGVALALAFLVTTAYAADDKKPTAQQEKMKACNAQATEKSLMGDERKAFMSDCLKAEPMTQQEKMTACNKDATARNLKGDERKAFMSECLKGEKKSTAASKLGLLGPKGGTLHGSTSGPGGTIRRTFQCTKGSYETGCKANKCTRAQGVGLFDGCSEFAKSCKDAGLNWTSHSEGDDAGGTCSVKQ